MELQITEKLLPLKRVAAIKSFFRFCRTSNFLSDYSSTLRTCVCIAERFQSIAQYYVN